MRLHRHSTGLCFLLAACSGLPGDSAPDPQVQRILGDDRYDWITLETENTRVHFPAGSYAESRAEVLPEQAEGARQTVLDRLSVSEYQGLLHLFYVDNRTDMANLTGSPVTGYSYYNDNAIVVVFNEHWRPFERHELTHTVTLSTWAAPAGPAVVEGMATYVEGTCAGYENGRIARTILDHGSMIELEELEGDFRQQNDLVAYLQAATLIEFVVDKSSPERLAVLWDQGLRALPNLLGVSPAAFRREYEGWLASKYDPIFDAAWEAIRAGGCGIPAPASG